MPTTVKVLSNSQFVLLQTTRATVCFVDETRSTRVRTLFDFGSQLSPSPAELLNLQPAGTDNLNIMFLEANKPSKQSTEYNYF